MKPHSPPTKRERVSVVVCHNQQLLCFFAIDPTSGKEYYFLPGGGIEPGEKLTQCGEREAWEETGYRVSAQVHSEIIHTYPFHWDGKDYLSTTHFFRATLSESFKPPGKVQDQDYNKGPRWIPFSDIEKYFAYTPEILDAIRALIY